MKNATALVLGVGAVGLLVWYLLRHAATSATTVPGAMTPPAVGFTPDVSAGTSSLTPTTKNATTAPVTPIESPVHISQLPVLGIPARLPVRTAFPSGGAATVAPAPVSNRTVAFAGKYTA